MSGLQLLRWPRQALIVGFLQKSPSHQPLQSRLKKVAINFIIIIYFFWSNKWKNTTLTLYPCQTEKNHFAETKNLDGSFRQLKNKILFDKNWLIIKIHNLLTCWLQTKRMKFSKQCDQLLKKCIMQRCLAQNLQLRRKIVANAFWTKIEKKLNLMNITFENSYNWLNKIKIWLINFESVQCDQIKSPNFYKSCPKMISPEKWNILTPLQNCLRMWEIWAN